MASRLNLHEELCALLGSRYVYFQPPESVKLKYPCIVYSRTGADTDYADDKVYNMTYQYTIQIISGEPDNELARELVYHFPMCRFMRRFVVDNLYHDNLNLYY